MIAILAPVPEELLVDSLEVGHEVAAFGSMAWEFFASAAPGTPVLLYASHASTFELAATWGATYERWVDAAAVRGDKEFEALYRSPLAGQDWTGPNDEGRFWAVFWIVRDLRRLERPVPLSACRTQDGKRLSPAFLPHGPIRVMVADP